ncbi:DUF1573 domain-containing protein [Zhouia sp. PK063]|uniref:DUF1573 domain-containing protein n=1 Tax=Zhouia sp. PK063 TaxID=3373602 RepID=UPI003798D8F0
MKKILLVLSVAATLAITSCKEKAGDATSKIKSENVAAAQERDEASKKLPTMEFDKTEYDFGHITHGKTVETFFTFKNTGNAPLIITNATSSCGCTVPEYPKNTPIQPGDSAKIKVTYNGSGMNEIHKTITLSANTKKGTEQLKITAFVDPDTSK